MARSILILVCLGVPLAAGAAVGDAAALARGDSLAAAGLYPEAAAEAEALLATIDARGDGDTMVAAEALIILLRSQLSRGGRLDPSAATHAERLLSLARDLEGPAGALVGKALMLSGQVAERGGDFAGARAAYTEALAVRAEAGLSADSDQVNYLVALANVRTRLGDYDGLGAVYEQALAIAVELEGPRSGLASRVLANYAIYAKRTGDFATARDLYERTLAIQVELYGEDNLSVARTHYNLGNLLTEMADYDAARTHYLQSLAIRERLLGPESPEVARTLSALALVEKDAADLLTARAHAERAVAIQRGALPPLHPQRADGLSVLAVIQADLGDLEAARITLEEVLAVYEQAYGPTHERVGGVIAEIGRINQLAGDPQGALAAYSRARAIFAADEGGREQLAGVLHVEARLRAELGPDPEALVLAEQAVALRREAPGPGNRALARPLATLGFCLWRAGEFAGADSCLGLALRYLAAAHDQEHPLFLLAQLDLARVRLDLGDPEGALDLALAVEQGRRAALRVIVRGLPERLALEHVRQWPSGVEFAAALVAAGAPAAADVARVWDEIVQSRALVLDEMAMRYRTASMSADAATDSLRRALAVVTRDEAGLLVNGWQGEDSDDLRARFGALSLRREQLERQLGERDPAASGSAPTLATVAAALPTDAALVAYVRCERRFDAEAGYVAFVLPAGQRVPVVVDLGSAAVVDRLVRTWRDEAGPGRDVPGRSPVDAEAACRRAGEVLRARVWDPLLPYLVGAAPVAIVPDGALHLVNFAALPTDGGRYLIDEPRPLVYLDAERDLVDHPQDRSAPGELLAFGAPTVGAGPAALGFAPLPASEEEVQSITALWRGARPDAAGDNAVLALLGPDASEASFKRLAPRYGAVHLATHGFWLADGAVVAPPGQRGVGGLMVDAGASRTLGGAAGPMLRSGLVLAGDASGEDGILTAAEITVLDLGGTDWVVLSACESGVGATTAGEGVLGLRRAFRLAGARNLVLSLWPLEDQTIRDWMLGLYAAHLTDRLELVPSAWQAARQVLAARRAAGLDTHPHTWAAFIACGG